MYVIERGGCRERGGIGDRDNFDATDRSHQPIRGRGNRIRKRYVEAILV